MSDTKNTPEDTYRAELRRIGRPVIDHVSRLADFTDMDAPEASSHAMEFGSLLAEHAVQAFRLGRESAEGSARILHELSQHLDFWRRERESARSRMDDRSLSVEARFFARGQDDALTHVINHMGEVTRFCEVLANTPPTPAENTPEGERLRAAVVEGMRLQAGASEHPSIDAAVEALANPPPTPAATPPDSDAENGSCTRDGGPAMHLDHSVGCDLLAKAHNELERLAGEVERKDKAITTFHAAWKGAEAEAERLAGEVEQLRGDHNALRREADRMAAGICLAIDTKQLDSRSHAADAVLDYCEGEPWSRDKCWRVLNEEGSDGE